ncbi:GNAT family N-acetyltransferase [Liquorilactobacillus mali]|uniref:Acetyltransferase n=1 Tax=Liquorilactobacillus mali KCTC 3596 = DSM 20444 TaxID=1046596 RepID=J0L3W7_9LACO|nr:GNAT family N-acetyltransferase [Liquorilactobacillus mali]EJE97961.1 acetyltransferase [Liquorilactobacillus mali KCTC 3596 = DSM 20444]KRN09158.1 acetyltransferase [Liquorilactobacillus mali KCTC 3596 = DSM 20444]MDC7952544.1 GNAT family N-acetyltransferase [Liquorilactobacillus mali]QFQ73686.1 GNAT family N-acetyltransferase [Liquorilactobacillus mali]
MIIETDRLNLIPLTVGQYHHWINNISILEKELSCSYQAEPLEGIFLNILKKQLIVTEKDARNYLYHTFWFLIRKTDRIVVGSADFKDLPNKQGEVEIGYGLGKNFEHKGYMTEAAKAMCSWALTQDNTSYVIAETEIENLASQNVLKRCGFKLYKQDNTCWWKLQMRK